MPSTIIKAEVQVQIFPSGPAVPENLLRIELRFSTPLHPALQIENLRLIDGHGAEIKDAFLDLPLPNPDGARVTVLFHPGRVKTGVGANLALGRALHAGETVTLLIEHPAWKNAVRKSWQVLKFDDQPPQPARWTVELPQAGTRSPLVLHLDKPISSSAEELIAIKGLHGRRLQGDAHLESGETVWRFVPSHPWEAGGYAVLTHPDLEDAAGNRPGAPFEENRARRTASAQQTVATFNLTHN
jgi:hypothetical protein